jgi:gamma-glutamylcyclotransferase (GGCT)/AIG2-like uncharacterized protein YtfP
VHVVTYGSLTFKEVMLALLNRDFQSEAVLLTNFARFQMIGKRYPGLIWTPESEVQGRIFFDLDERSLEILDRFEDEAYERTELEVVGTTRGTVNARAYVIPVGKRSLLSDSPWSPEEFEKEHLQDYIAMCERFRAKLNL